MFYNTAQRSTFSVCAVSLSESSLALPLFLIIAGALWFLKTTDILPATSILIATALGIAGVVVLLMDGINKQSIVAGPMLMYIGAGIYLRGQQYFVGLPTLIALGMMILGCLLLLSRSSIVPFKQIKHPPSIE